MVQKEFRAPGDGRLGGDFLNDNIKIITGQQKAVPLLFGGFQRKKLLDSL